MPISTYWIEEPWIRAVDMTGYLTLDDMRHIIADSILYLRQHPTYFLIDMSQSTGVDPHVFELSSLSEWIYHPNGRWFVYVQPNGAFKSIMKMRQRGNFKGFDERDEALDFLQRATLNEKARANHF